MRRRRERKPHHGCAKHGIGQVHNGEPPKHGEDKQVNGPQSNPRGKHERENFSSPFKLLHQDIDLTLLGTRLNVSLGPFADVGHNVDKVLHQLHQTKGGKSNIAHPSGAMQLKKCKRDLGVLSIKTQRGTQRTNKNRHGGNDNRNPKWNCNCRTSQHVQWLFFNQSFKHYKPVSFHKKNEKHQTDI